MKEIDSVQRVRLVYLSDTHGLHRQAAVPKASSCCMRAILCARAWIRPRSRTSTTGWPGLPHPYKIGVAGNHDLLFEREPKRARKLLRYAVYLENAAAEIGGLRFWGSPVTPVRGEFAFRAERCKALRELWGKVLARVDVLLTHGPPFGTLDQENVLGEHYGCRELTRAVLRAKPKLHVFGHVHGGWGQETCGDEDAGTQFVNCALLAYGQGFRSPTIIEL